MPIERITTIIKSKFRRKKDKVTTQGDKMSVKQLSVELECRPSCSRWTSDRTESLSMLSSDLNKPIENQLKWTRDTVDTLSLSSCDLHQNCTLMTGDIDKSINSSASSSTNTELHNSPHKHHGLNAVFNKQDNHIKLTPVASNLRTFKSQMAVAPTDCVPRASPVTAKTSKSVQCQTTQTPAKSSRRTTHCSFLSLFTSCVGRKSFQQRNMKSTKTAPHLDQGLNTDDISTTPYTATDCTTQIAEQSHKTSFPSLTTDPFHDLDIHSPTDLGYYRAIPYPSVKSEINKTVFTSVPSLIHQTPENYNTASVAETSHVAKCPNYTTRDTTTREVEFTNKTTLIPLSSKTNVTFNGAECKEADESMMGCEAERNECDQSLVADVTADQFTLCNESGYNTGKESILTDKSMLAESSTRFNNEIDQSILTNESFHTAADESMLNSIVTSTRASKTAVYYLRQIKGRKWCPRRQQAKISGCSGMKQFMSTQICYSRAKHEQLRNQICAVNEENRVLSIQLSVSAGRKEELEQMLKETAESRCQLSRQLSVSRAARQQLQDELSATEYASERLTAQLSETRDNCEELQGRLHASTLRCERLSVKLFDLRKTINEVEHKVSDSKQALVDISANLSCATSQQKELDNDLSASQLAVRDLADKLQSSNARQQQLQTELFNSDQQINVLDDQLSESQTHRERLEADLSASEQAISEVSVQLSNSALYVQQLKHQLCTSKKQACRLAAELSNTKLHSKELEKQLCMSKNAVSNLVAKLYSSASQHKQLQCKLTESQIVNNELETKLSGSQSYRKSLEDHLSSTKQAIHDITTELSSLVTSHRPEFFDQPDLSQSTHEARLLRSSVDPHLADQLIILKTRQYELEKLISDLKLTTESLAAHTDTAGERQDFISDRDNCDLEMMSQQMPSFLVSM